MYGPRGLAKINFRVCLTTALLVSVPFAPLAAKSLQTGTSDATFRFEQFLNKETSYRLLNRQDVRNERFEPYSTFHAFSISDTNGDGKPDIVAVLVKRSNPSLYSLIVLHGGSAEALWVKRDIVDKIISVEARPKEIWPIICTECDANRPLRWTGTEYDSGVYFPGEKACVSKGEVLREKPEDESPALVELPNTLETEVIEIGKRDVGKDRWFRVRVPNGRFALTGWIRTYKSWEPGNCD